MGNKNGNGVLDPNSLDNWDPAFLARFLPLGLALRDLYYRATVTGLSDLPDGPFVLAGIHGGGLMSADSIIIGTSFYAHTKLRRPLYSLAHRVLFLMPGLNRIIAKVGAVLATRENARRILQAGHPILVFPGGDHDMARPWSRRNVVSFAGRSGFVRTALEAGVPIVPVGTAGGHETWRVLSDGAGVCRALGLKRLANMETLPIALALPWGLTVGYLPYLPLPAKVDVAFGKPMRFTPSAREKDDPQYHGLVRDAVQGAVQRLVDELVAARGRAP
jgi:1-acyl-sn-glycerol-3-phosphate acyltransferase